MDESRKQFENWFSKKSVQFKINGLGLIHINRIEENIVNHGKHQERR